MYKAIGLLLLLLLPAIAVADRSIITPSGYTTSTGFDGDVFEASNGKPQTFLFADAGVENLQITAAYGSRGSYSRAGLSVQSYLLPETFTTPAVSVGVEDITNSDGAFGRDGFYGRTFYFAVTKSLDTTLNPPQIHGILLSGGVGVGGYRGIFGAVSADLLMKLSGTVEYDSRRMNYRLSLPVGSRSNFSYNCLGRSNFFSLDLHAALSM